MEIASLPVPHPAKTALEMEEPALPAVKIIFSLGIQMAWEDTTLLLTLTIPEDPNSA